MLKLFNTLTRKKEPFVPINKNEVGIYTCGPSVYDRAHIGNFRTFLFEDVLVRYFKYRGFRVKWVMNITDVEDEAIKKAREAGKPLREYTSMYADDFFEDSRKLNLLPADAYPRVSDHIPQIVDFIKRIVNNGYAYREKDGTVYLDISKFRDYGKLSRLKLKIGKKRIKRDDWGEDTGVVADFALWKSYEKEDGDAYWETELGKGRPGWHIECSALSAEYLGRKFDIQMGGVDNIFPHHENAIVQNLAAYNEMPANYWIHSRHLTINGKKMSKSSNNFYTLNDLMDKGSDPRAVRLALITAPYRRRLDFNMKMLDEAVKTIRDIEGLVKHLEYLAAGAEETGPADPDIGKLAGKTLEKFIAAIEDNLNTRKAIQVLSGFVENVKTLDVRCKDAKIILASLNDMGYILGLGLSSAILFASRNNTDTQMNIKQYFHTAWGTN